MGGCGVEHLRHHTRASCPSEPARGAQSINVEKLGTAAGVAVARKLKWEGLTGIPLVILRHLVGTHQGHRKSRPRAHQEMTFLRRLPEGVAHGTICELCHRSAVRPGALEPRVQRGERDGRIQSSLSSHRREIFNQFSSFRPKNLPIMNSTTVM